MGIQLVCVSATDGLVRGDLVTDPAQVEKYLQGDVAHHFNKIEGVAQTPAPEPPAAEPPAAEPPAAEPPV
jgi:hypothetical protein